MDITLKKRIVGFLLLFGIVLMIVPVLFGRSISADELKLSGRIPATPPKPDNISVPIPPQTATVPTIEKAPPSGLLSSTDQTVQAVSPPPLPVVDAVKPKQAETAAQPTTSKTPQPTPSSVVSNDVMPVAPPVAPKSAPLPTSKSHTTDLAAPKNPLKKVVRPAVPAGVQAWSVQLGSFSQKSNAENLTKKLQAKGFPAYMSTRTTDGATKVLVGPHLHHADAEHLKTRIQKEFDIQGVLVKIG